MKFWKKLDVWKQALAVGVAIAIGSVTIYAKYIKTEDRIAKNESGLTKLTGKVNNFQIQYDIDNLRRSLWKLEDRYGGQGCPRAPSPVKDECRRLSNHIMSLLAKLVKS